MSLVVSRKAFWDYLSCNWTTCFFFFPCSTILFQRTTGRQTMVIQTWIFDRHFIENKWSESVTSRKKLIVFFFPKDKTQAFRQKFWFLENLCVLPRAQQHPDIKRLFWLWWWYYQMWFFLILCNEICQHLEDSHNLDSLTLQNRPVKNS